MKPNQFDKSNPQHNRFEDELKVAIPKIHESISRLVRFYEEQAEMEKWLKDVLDWDWEDAIACSPEDYDLDDESEEYLAQEIQKCQEIARQIETGWDEICSFFVPTRFFPLAGLSRLSRRDKSILGLSSLTSEKEVDKFLEQRMFIMREDQCRRFKKLPAALWDINLPYEIKVYYSEAAKCHVDGSFHASRALCRALVECLVKYKIFKVDLGPLLNDPKWTNTEILRRKMLCPEELVQTYIKIRDEGNLVLHEIIKTVKRGSKLPPNEQSKVKSSTASEGRDGKASASGIQAKECPAEEKSLESLKLVHRFIEEFTNFWPATKTK